MGRGPHGHITENGVKSPVLSKEIKSEIKQFSVKNQGYSSLLKSKRSLLGGVRILPFVLLLNDYVRQ